MPIAIGHGVITGIRSSIEGINRDIRLGGSGRVRYSDQHIIKLRDGDRRGGAFTGVAIILDRGKELFPIFVCPEAVTAIRQGKGDGAVFIGNAADSLVGCAIKNINWQDRLAGWRCCLLRSH